MYKSNKLKIRYNLLGIVFIWICIAITAYPAWVIAKHLALILNIPNGVPVKEQENGLLWIGLFFIEAIALFCLAYGALAYLVSKFFRWSSNKYIEIFFKSKYPSQWYK